MTGDHMIWMWTEACTMIERAERMHRQFFQPSLSAAPAARWEPPIDVFESDSEVRIIAALPGVDPQDIEAHLDANQVVIAGVRRLPAMARGATIHRMEIPHGRFERRIRLSEPLQLVRSELMGGCLVLRLAKQR